MILKSNKQRLPWDAVLFFALYIILPSYFGLELSGKMPLITVSRLLLVLMGVMCLVRNRYLLPGKGWSIKKLNLALTDNKFLRWSLIIYFALLCLCNLVHLFETSDSIKAIFTLIAEEYLLVWVLTIIIDSRQKLIGALRVMVISAAAVAAITTVGCLLEVNPFYYLNTVQRDMLMAGFYRLGMLRAEAGFGHPVYYGGFCAVILPLCLYFVEQSKGPKELALYSVCTALNVVGLVLANSRGSLIAFGFTLVVYVCLKLFLGFTKDLCKRYASAIAATLAALLLVTALSPTGTEFLGGVMHSVTDSILPGQDVPDAETPPDDTEEPGAEGDYGLNPNGVQSRLIQLHGIRWTLMHKPVFGFGVNAHVRRLVCYQFVEGVWTPTSTFDMDLVAIVAQYGIVGLMGWIALYGAIVLVLLRKKVWKDSLNIAFGAAFICYYVCMLSITSQQKLFWVLLGLLVCHIRLLPTEKAEKF